MCVCERASLAPLKTDEHTPASPLERIMTHACMQQSLKIPQHSQKPESLLIMSKEGCKVGCKHKERKPKKPHYIPRPWGKPYNYKCFQCPFTCMEKSHLYNHMKYSLCKNSLSLLIESDWPCKKEQMRLQTGNHHPRSPNKGHSEQTDILDEASLQNEKKESEKDDEIMDTSPPPISTPESDGMCPRGVKRSKQEADMVMADVFSLEEQLLRARSVEGESKLRHYRLSKTCLSGQTALLSEQWRILSNQTTNSKPKSDLLASSIPCYPPSVSTSQIECPESPSFNLSLLGVGYPLAPGLLSYLNPALTTINPGSTSTPLPFLSSNTQIGHSQRLSERHLLPPHLYYPFLCEHTFGAAPSSETAKLNKAPRGNLQTPSYPTKMSLWKVPALRPSATSAWPAPTASSPEPTVKRASLSSTLPPLDSHDATEPKKSKQSLESVKHSEKAAPGAPQMPGRATTHSSELSSNPRLSEDAEQKHGSLSGRDSALLQGFSSLLQEYQQTEQQIACMALPAHRCQLWAHLGKIRSELCHIQQALEQTTPSQEGPLDLSVKKIADVKETCSETEEEEEEDDEDDEGDKERLMKLKMEVIPEALWHSRTTKCEADSSVLQPPGNH
ncbi:hypothetical protein DNTS_005720 [Danionella cerebrum]|uniref:Zinc finger protein 750-like zinc finger domain-containing protein n=1 Tax=Danionella cerebrum TaxID=2873325 RepID=A0A553QSL6_9TELE|nr:hypothetical protein DNTS_005720 [Danionella translucida]